MRLTGLLLNLVWWACFQPASQRAGHACTVQTPKGRKAQCMPIVCDFERRDRVSNGRFSHDKLVGVFRTKFFRMEIPAIPITFINRINSINHIAQ